jgi:hypothetical protein
VKARIVWADPVRDLFLSLPEHDRNEILSRMELVKHFPLMYPARTKGKRFRRHRWFYTRNWLVYYRGVDDTVYVRGLWPAQIP